VRIEKVDLKDKEEIIELSKDSFEWGDYIEYVFDEWLRSGIFLKAVENGEILGFLHVRLFDEFSWLEGLRVKKEYRRKGIATELTKSAMKISGKNIHRLMILETNVPSIELSKKLGFKPIDRVYYNYGEKKSADEIIREYNLIKKDEKLRENYVDKWVYLDFKYYLDYIYSNHNLSILRTDPPFVINGSINYENISRSGGNECFIIFEKR
jgi:ribosomal protein S18 acetylase RimI-like enzyme